MIFLRVCCATIVLLGLTGCAQTRSIRVQVVDATTSQPVPEVSTVWREDSAYNLLTGKRHQTGPTNLPVSSLDGIIRVTDVHPKMVSRFVFSQPNYETAYGIYGADAGTFTLGAKTNSRIPGGRFVLDAPYTNIFYTNGLFLVPIHRR